ncbi:MAG: hypothetical protein I8H87_11690 [Comamonadaceae bacterium]|nr:hypothetical protein [Comamonadaceae bacterium]
MKFGQQLEVPEGLGCLAAGTRYYYSGRSAANGILLIWFYISKDKQWRVGYVHMADGLVEKELTRSPPGLRPCKRQIGLPPALVDLEGINCEELSAHTFSRKQSHLDGVQHRLEAIFPLLENEQEILQAPNPLKEIARLQKRLGLATHVHRLQYWFFCYLLHGRNQWSLKPNTHGNGTWSRRADAHAEKKFGRPHANGKRRGWPSTCFREQVIESYLSRCGLGKTMRSICSAALLEDFGCITVFDDQGGPQLIHLTNRPFPSYGQFRQIVIDKFSLKQVQSAVYGQARMRRDAVVDEGSYSSQYGNALESLEVDAYRCDDRPIASTSDSTMPALIAARAICGVTGKRLGIGFSLGGETQEAYRSMLASMAMPAEMLARMYGIPEEVARGHEPCMARSVLSDRGPAGQQSLLNGLEAKFPVKAITASYSGQSKPTVESSNPRSTALEGAPSFMQSSHTVASMMKREVLRTLAENYHTNIIERLTPSALHEFHTLGYPATPHFYWKYLSDRLRTCAQNMDWRDSIRAFATATKFKVDKAGLEWKGVTFSSTKFREGPHEKLIRRGVATVNGFTLSLVVRAVWVEIDGNLNELEPNLRVQSDREELLLPLSSLVDIEQLKSEVNSSTREAAQAMIVRLRKTVKEQTGLPIDAGHRRGGSPKKGGAASAEAKALRGVQAATGRRRA